MVRHVLIPQFSIRWLLAVTAGCAVVFSVFGLAARGSLWAAGVSIAVGSLVLLLLVHAAAFGLLWVFAELAGRFSRSARGGSSPFGPGVPAVGAGPRPRGPSMPRGDGETPATPIILD